MSLNQAIGVAILVCLVAVPLIYGYRDGTLKWMLQGAAITLAIIVALVLALTLIAGG